MYKTWKLSPDPQWSEQFQLGWATLEEVNAVLLHQGRKPVNDEAEALVRNTTDELLALVRMALASASESGQGQTRAGASL